MPNIETNERILFLFCLFVSSLLLLLLVRVVFFLVNLFRSFIFIGQIEFIFTKGDILDEKRIHTALCDSNESHEERSYYNNQIFLLRHISISLSLPV